MSVVAIVQLPPPVTGLSLVNTRIVEELHLLGRLMCAIDVSPPHGSVGRQKYIGRAFRTLLAATALVRGRLKGARAVYMPCDGGAGLILNVALAAAARMLGLRLSLHHHSYAYLNRRSLLMSLLLMVAPRGTHHLVLCGDMLRRLQSLYPRAWDGGRHKACILSNAFLPNVELNVPVRTGQLTIGHLSNLTVEKGSVRFISIFRVLRDEGVPVLARIAGPIGDEETRTAIRDAIRDYGDAFAWLGPVYGEDKTHFYQSIDAFIFPSDYANEAQPVVLLEALANGAAVLATARGCMACDHSQSPGLIASSEVFNFRAIAWLRAHVEPDKRRDLTVKSTNAFNIMRTSAERELAAAIDQV